MTEAQPAKRSRRPGAFVCPGCPGDPLLYVLQTRRLANGAVVRYRRCVVCGKKAKTVERVVPTK